MATMKRKVAQEVKLPRELTEFDPWTDGWFDKAYNEATTSHDSSSLAYCARSLWRKARTEAGATEQPSHVWRVLRESAVDYLELKGHEREGWVAEEADD